MCVKFSQTHASLLQVVDKFKDQAFNSLIVNGNDCSGIQDITAGIVTLRMAFFKMSISIFKRLKLSKLNSQICLFVCVLNLVSKIVHFVLLGPLYTVGDVFFEVL